MKFLRSCDPLGRKLKAETHFLVKQSQLAARIKWMY